MPLERVQHNHKPAYRWGRHGHPYSYTAGNKRSRERAKKKALKQGLAIEYRKHKGKRPRRFKP